jgi:mono/diheme cytochrome c family protein
MCRRAFVLSAAVLSLFLTARDPAAGEAPLPAVVEYNRDIRPILSDNCYACHGPDKNARKAELRLDDEAEAKKDRGGYHAIVPNKPDDSELIWRLTVAEEHERMPPRKFGKRLTERQVALLKNWIAQGAKWEKHWSLIPPNRAPLPVHAGTRVSPFLRNPIDHFILARLEQESLPPSPLADPRTLIRRLHFDLIGLPPRPEDVDAFVADPSDAAYERVVDRLLASPHYGERMATYWLDLVRYADSIGYHSDNPRNVSPYRDYVIRAFNENKRFDQFTKEQLAGDLLPNATLWQRVASGYNRLLQTTEEGGAQPKEYQAKYMADRVRNVGSVWLGLTMGCCECHDHKFDPFKMRDFYSLQALFADVQEAPVGRREPGMLVPTEKQAAELKRVEGLASQSLEKLQQPKRELTPVALFARLPVVWADPVFAEFVKHEKAKTSLTNNIPRALVSVSGPPRDIRILPRGNWLDDSGEVVQPAFPGVLWRAPDVSPGSASKQRLTRLDLANWLVSRDHPLTARVFVNRQWKLYFGHGLARSLEDFGAQGEWPTHPDLLDWLAVEFMDSGWNVKHMIKLMVMSGTYRQSSITDKKTVERDPGNRLLARQSRFRLDAEVVRDNALAISGLLSSHIGGDSVKPYQPPGYWAYLNFPTREWQNDTGDKLYRRTLYTHWQRTFLHPSLLAFDAPTREECTCERPRSNIPQQALVLLNDPIYVEAARVFAERIMKEGGQDAESRIRFVYRRALQRAAKPEEVKLLHELQAKHLAQYQADKGAAAALLNVGAHAAPADIDAAELAAWTSVARVILNLHEGITRE